MALIKCPDCGKMISDSATMCVGCGRPMKRKSEGVIDYKISPEEMLSEQYAKENRDRNGWIPFLY